MNPRITANRPKGTGYHQVARADAEDHAFDGITATVASLCDLQRQMAELYTPVVQRIIRTHSRDVQEIEHTLDHLFSCAGHPEGLQLFKSLCRYYYGIDPVAAAQHVYLYRDWYDNPDDEDPA